MHLTIKKYLPNAITLLRLIFSPALLLLEPFSNRFLLLYALLGLSDILDGFLARRWNVSSRCGVLLYLLFNSLCWPLGAIILVGIIFVIRLASLTVCYIRFSQIAFLHTYSNKATGFLLLLFPLFIRFIGQDWTLILLSSVASISAIEEFCISVISSEFDANRKSIFSKKPPADRSQG